MRDRNCPQQYTFLRMDQILTSPGTKTEMMTNQTTPVTGTVYLCIPFVPCPQFFVFLNL
jgi:hypothetical protein